MLMSFHRVTDSVYTSNKNFSITHDQFVNAVREISYHSLQSLLSSRLLSRNVKVKIYKTIILPVVLYGCETWSLTLREQHILRVFENRVLRRGMR
jgi:hypothetical protein